MTGLLEEFQMTQLYTDSTQAVIGNKMMTKVGSLREWAAYIKAGYVVNGPLRVVKGRSDTYGLTMVSSELRRYVAELRDEEIEMGTTPEDYLTYVNYHSEYFANLKRNADL